MSLWFEYRVGEKKHPVRLAMADFDLIQDALMPVLSQEISKIIDTPDHGVEAQIGIKEVLEAIDKVVEWVRANPDKMPYTYQTKLVGWELDGHKMDDQFSTGGYGGLQLPGDEKYYYGVSAGCNECKMTKHNPGIKPPANSVVEEIDIRDRKTIETSNMGTLHIRKRKARSKLVAELLRLRGFLDSQDAKMATKIIG